MNPPFRWDQDNPVFFSQTEFKVLKNPKGRFNPDQIVFHDLILVQNPSFALKNPRFYPIRDLKYHWITFEKPGPGFPYVFFLSSSLGRRIRSTCSIVWRSSLSSSGTSSLTGTPTSISQGEWNTKTHSKTRCTVWHLWNCAKIQI